MNLDAPNFQHLPGQEALATDRGNLMLGVDPDGVYVPMLVTSSGAPVGAELAARGKLVTPGDSWTSADVDGALTSVTAIVVTGTMTVTDSAGTVLAGLPVATAITWAAGDTSTLVGPTSIASVGGQVVVAWTERA